MRPYRGKKTFDFPNERNDAVRHKRGAGWFSPRINNVETNLKHINTSKLAARKMRTISQYQRPISICSVSSRSRGSRSSNTSRLISPRTKKITDKQIHVNFMANLPTVLQKILSNWDTGSRSDRKQILEKLNI